MGDTWGPGSREDDCDEDEIFDCDQNAMRNDAVGWIKWGDDPNPDDGIDINIYTEEIGDDTCLRGLAVKGIHSNTIDNPTLFPYWIDGDWRFSNPTGVTFVPNGHKYTYLVWYVTAGWPKIKYDYRKPDCPLMTHKMCKLDKYGEMTNMWGYTPQSWLAFQDVNDDDLNEAGSVGNELLYFKATSFYNEAGERKYRAFSPHGFKWKPGQCGRAAVIDHGLTKFLMVVPVYVSHGDLRRICNVQEHIGFDSSSPLCKFKEDTKGGVLLYGAGRPANKTPLYLAYMPFSEFRSTVDSGENKRFVWYFTGNINGDNNAAWSRDEQDAVPLPHEYWNKKKDNRLPCDELSEFAPSGECHDAAQDFAPEACTIHKRCWWEENPSYKLVGGRMRCHWGDYLENSDEQNIFGLMSSKIIRENVKNTAQPPRLLLFYSWNSERQVFDAAFEEETDIHVRTFYRTARLSRPWDLSERREARDGNGKSLDGYGPHIIEKHTEYQTDYRGINNNDGLVVWHTISTWAPGPNDGSPEHPYGIYTRPTLIGWPPSDGGALTAIVVDRSGSMGAVDGISGLARLDAAKSGAELILSYSKERDSSSWMDEDLSIRIFNHETKCIGLDPDLDSGSCNFGDLSDNIDDFKSSIGPCASFDANGRTALLHAVKDAVEELSNAKDDYPDKMRVLYLVTDGRDNVSDDSNVEEMFKYAEQNNITVNALTIGRGADAELIERLVYPGDWSSSKTGIKSARIIGRQGSWAHAENADSIPNRLMALQIRNNGGSLVIPLQEAVTPPKKHIEFDIEPGADELIVLLTNHGYIDADRWDVNIKLTALDGNEEIEKSSNSLSNEVTVIDNALISIRIPEPSGGTWRLQVESNETDSPMMSYLTVGITNPAVQFDVYLSPRILTQGDSTTVTPVITYGGINLDVNYAGCEGELYGPAGFHETFDLNNTKARISKGEPPVGIINTFNGRGAYRVEVSCTVTQDIKTSFGSGLAVTPFNRKSTAHFFLDTSQMPMLIHNIVDNDKDGIPDKDEPNVDFDKDGFNAVWDDDDDDDDVIDGVDAKSEYCRGI